MFSQTVSAAVPAASDSPAAPGVGGSCTKPLGFWLYVLFGVVMIIASAIALPFVAIREP